MKKNLLSLSLIISISAANASDINKVQTCGGVLLALAAVAIPSAIVDYCTGYTNQKKVIKYLEQYVRDIKQGKDKISVLQEAAENTRIVKLLPYYLVHHTHEYVESAQQWSLDSRVEYLNSLVPQAMKRIEAPVKPSLIQKFFSYLAL